jgi:hypothetical protein
MLRGSSPPIMASRRTRETSGRTVLLRMLSMFRAPLSTSVQRWAISSSTALS